MDPQIHHLNFAMACSGAQYIRKEVPLQVLPARYLLKLDSPLTSFTDMQHVLFEEERSAYNQAISQNMRWWIVLDMQLFCLWCHFLRLGYPLLIFLQFVTSGGKMHPLTFVHHTSTYQASLCKLMEYWWVGACSSPAVWTKVLFWAWCFFRNFCSLSPAVNALQDRLKENEIRVIRLIFFFHNFW